MQTTTTPLDSTGALRAAFCAVPVAESILHDAICAYVDEAKRRQWPVERVLIEVKRIAEVENGPTWPGTRDAGKRREGEELVRKAVSWCIARYYWTMG